ncbi:cupin domain-containing protein [Nocardia sp. A7]|uniref:cupin domain-containing protein n=1 Tax=Nocardia sp. A7 TaxID=2789274 RepID=UPI00397C5039
MADIGSVLTFRNGHRVTLVDRGADARGAYLRLEHVLPHIGRQAGPHWHPEIGETWTVRTGQVRFRVDGAEIVAGPGDTVTAPPQSARPRAAVGIPGRLSRRSARVLAAADLRWIGRARAAHRLRPAIARDRIRLSGGERAAGHIVRGGPRVPLLS